MLLVGNESLTDVLESFEVRKETRLVDSTTPYSTDLDVDLDRIERAVSDVGLGNFLKRGIIVDTPRNLLEGVDVRLTPNVLTTEKIADSHQSRLLEAFEPEIIGIDSLFRVWANIDPQMPTKPWLNVFSGRFQGRPAETNRHFDYSARRPLVSFKLHFMGEPEHTSIYYPGKYKLPNRFTEFQRAMAGIGDPSYPKRLFRRAEEVSEAMPFGEVCAEPWNAFHSGPTAKSARGINRGILSVTYSLNAKELEALETDQALQPQASKS